MGVSTEARNIGGLGSTGLWQSGKRRYGVIADSGLDRLATTDAGLFHPTLCTHGADAGTGARRPGMCNGFVAKRAFFPDRARIATWLALPRQLIRGSTGSAKRVRLRVVFRRVSGSASRHGGTFLHRSENVHQTARNATPDFAGVIRGLRLARLWDSVSFQDNCRGFQSCESRSNWIP